MAKKQKGKKRANRTFGVGLLAAGAAAIGLGAALGAALLFRSRRPEGHPAPDLAADQPAPTAHTRAPEHFRPDPTAVPTAEEREALRPAAGHAPGFSADRGSTVQ